MRAERILGIGAITTTNGPFASATPFENPDRPGHDSDRRRSRAICTAGPAPHLRLAALIQSRFEPASQQ
jgi:hypothetical protein